MRRIKFTEEKIPADVSEAKRLKELERRNRELKKQLADALKEEAALKALLAKKTRDKS